MSETSRETPANPLFFTIKRAKWLFGPKAVYIRHKGKMDAIGFYLYACGYKKKELKKQVFPELEDQTRIPDWMLNNSEKNLPSSIAERINSLNDADMKKKDREEAIRQLFDSVGILVRFKGEYR